jgi:hypothetical protein
LFSPLCSLLVCHFLSCVHACLLFSIQCPFTCLLFYSPMSMTCHCFLFCVYVSHKLLLQFYLFWEHLFLFPPPLHAAAVYVTGEIGLGPENTLVQIQRRVSAWWISQAKQYRGGGGGDSMNYCDVCLGLGLGLFIFSLL